MKHNISDVERYWNSHLNCTQFLTDESLKNTDIGSDDFYKKIEDSFKRYSYKDEVFREFARDCSGKKLLEVGCGLGIELGRLGKCGYEVTGIDLASRAVELANAYLKKQQVKGKAMIANVEQLDFPDESFDAVYSSGVLHHTPNIEKAIKEIRRVLKPGGKLLIVLYHRHSWFYLLHTLSGMHIEFDDEDAPIINAYSRKELQSFFSDFGNVSIASEYYLPEKTGRRGVLPFLYNQVFVPVTRILPKLLIKRFGWHLVLTATKKQ